MKRIDELCSDAKTKGCNSISTIEAYEKVLSVTFPNDYKYYLLNYGNGHKNGVEISGISNTIHSDSNIIGYSVCSIRKYIHFPKNYLFFSDSGDGGLFCFDQNWKIHLVYAVLPNGVDDKIVANSFLEFLEKYWC